VSLWRSVGRRTEAGSALVEFTWLAILLLIPLVYVVITLVTVQRSAYGATEAARAAGRAYILAPDVETAGKRAFDAARLSMQDQGVVIEPRNVAIRCKPTPQSCLQPGSSVEVTVHVDVELPLVPTIYGRAPASIAIRASHQETYGVYRESRS
jgi:hypothetical protein